MILISHKEIQLVKDWMEVTSKEECHQINLKLVKLGVKKYIDNSFDSFHTRKGIIILNYLEKQKIYPLTFCKERNYKFYKEFFNSLEHEY